MNITLFTDVACEPGSRQIALVIVPAVDRPDGLKLTSDVSCIGCVSQECREDICELHDGVCLEDWGVDICYLLLFVSVVKVLCC